MNYSTALAESGIRSSAEGVGDSCGNALTEKSNGVYKVGLIWAKPARTSAKEVEATILKWVHWRGN